ALRLGRSMDEVFNEIFIIDQETFKFIQVNQSARRNMQYTAEEMYAMTPADINPDYTLEQLKAMVQTLKDGTESLLVVQAAHQRKDETVYPVEVRIQLSKHETPPKIVAIVQDITERQKAEQAVQQAMQTLEKRVQERTADLERLTRENELILNAAGEGIYGLDREGNTTFVNPAAEQILGFSAEDLVGKAHHDMCHHQRADGSMYPKHECPIQKTLEDGQAYKAGDEVFWRKDGTAVPVEYVSNPIHEDGKVIGAVVTFKDITERKKAEEQLWESETRFNQLAENVNDIFWIVALEWKKIIYVSPSYEKIWGHKAEDLYEDNTLWLNAIHPDDLERMQKVFAEGDLVSNLKSLEYRVIRPDGEVRFFKAAGFPVVNQQGEIYRIAGITSDISESKKAEQDLILAKEEAERASKAKSQFLSQMSHELRTPLNAILGFGQLMESDPEEPLTEYQQQSVSEILKAGKHLLELINEILDLSRIEAGHLTLSFENVNLNYLTEELVTLCAPMAKKNNIELLNYVPLHDDLFVYADRVRLKQVLLNLVSNAIKYNKASGSVKIDATGNRETGIRISVSDTGIGIPEDRLDDLFQPFNRLGSEKTDIEGTGVGLTITKQLVELMNGSIEVDSRLGEGSTFSVTLPWGQPEEESKVLRPTEAAHNPSSLTPRDRWVILYVEDNPASLNLVRQILRRRSDVLLLTAPEAKLGIELAQAHQPDLILLDLNLPGMDGLTAFKRLRALKETKTTPVVAISANALPRDIKIALDTGFSDYLTKPLDVVEFNRTVEDHLQTRLQRKPSNS
ncbi:MAG: PAS domain S-box protein, partial [Nitrospinae bacterium]|nr:PAS domain S-box protein [Nitrospinota bacterium]